MHTIGHHESDVGREERRDFRLVCLKLLEGCPDGGVLIRRVLEFDHRECQTVDEQHDVRAARVLPIGHRELVHREPIIVAGIIEIQDSRLCSRDRTVIAAIFDCNAVHHHAMHGAILFY